MLRRLLLSASVVLVAACASPSPQPSPTPEPPVVASPSQTDEPTPGSTTTPTPEPTPLPSVDPAAVKGATQRYAAAFAENLASHGVYVVISFPCAQRPTSWEMFLAYCDTDKAEMDVTDEATWNATNPGDPWPPTGKSNQPLGTKVK